MSKLCIFNSSKLCDDCGECYVCDLNTSKKCDNCGKCINNDDLDMRAVEVDDIWEEDELNRDEEWKMEDLIDGIQSQSSRDVNDDGTSEELESWDLIDDVEGLNEILNDKTTFKDRATEIFPGLIVIKK